MLLNEFQSKALFRAEGIATPAGTAVRTPEELERAAAGLRPPMFLKAQVLSGGRGKAGGVRKAATAGEAKTFFQAIKSAPTPRASGGNMPSRIRPAGWDLPTSW